MALETPYGVRTLTMARSVRSIENRVYPVSFRFKFNVCTLHANSCTTYTISAEVEPSRATYTTTEYKQVTWRFQCQSRWPFNRNTVLAVGRRRSGTCKGGLPRPPLGSGWYSEALGSPGSYVSWRSFFQFWMLMLLIRLVGRSLPSLGPYLTVCW